MIGDDKYVNGNTLSWGSFTVKVDGDELAGFFGITYSHKRTRVKGYSLGPAHAPTRRSKGKYEVENVKLKGYASSMQALRQKLADVSGNGSYGDVEFEVLVQGIEPNENEITVVLERCAWAATAGAVEEGPDLVTEEIDLDCMSVTENGLTLHDPAT